MSFFDEPPPDDFFAADITMPIFSSDAFAFFRAFCFSMITYAAMPLPPLMSCFFFFADFRLRLILPPLLMLMPLATPMPPAYFLRRR